MLATSQFQQQQQQQPNFGNFGGYNQQKINYLTLQQQNFQYGAGQDNTFPYYQNLDVFNHVTTKKASSNALTPPREFFWYF